MAWVETTSPSFVARHESVAVRGGRRRCSRTSRHFRESLEGMFEPVPRGVSVVIHPRPLMLALAAPWLPLARAVSAPAGRRYFAGWFARSEIHVLAPDALERRASGVAGSREALLRSPRHEYAHIVLGGEQPVPASPVRPAHLPPLRADGVAMRGRRHVARGPGAAPARGDRPAHARGRAARVPARRPRCPGARRHRLRDAGTRSAGGRRALDLARTSRSTRVARRRWRPRSEGRPRPSSGAGWTTWPRSRTS